jgi:uncharacterized protein YdcH (DUF465 family)
MIVSLAEAAELTGKSRQTIYRKVKKGELAVTTREDNSKGVDTSELERVFGMITVQEAGATDVTVSETAIREDTVQAEERQAEETQLEEMQPEFADVADLERELASARAVQQLYQETINELKTDKLKLWDQVVSQQKLLERNEQMITSLQSHRVKKLTKIADEGALFGLAGVCIGAIFFVLTSAL